MVAAQTAVFSETPTLRRLSSRIHLSQSESANRIIHLRMLASTTIKAEIENTQCYRYGIKLKQIPTPLMKAVKSVRVNPIKFILPS